MASADYIFNEELGHILATLMPANRLACEVSLCTGLRISDVLLFKTVKLAQRMTIKEMKTGKTKSVYLPKELYERCLNQAGAHFVFEGRLDGKKPRTRQAVWKDLKRSADLFRLPKALNISPHSMRKVYAVDKYTTKAQLADVKKLLNHSSEAVTILYAMADVLTQRKLNKVHSNYDVKNGSKTG